MPTEYTGTYVLVKPAVSKVRTVLAYDVTRSSVGCQLMCQPRHLTTVQNYEALLAVLKLRKEARNRQPGTFNSNQTKQESEH